MDVLFLFDVEILFVYYIEIYDSCRYNACFRGIELMTWTEKSCIHIMWS